MIKPEDFENERIIWREEIILKPFRIPEGHIKCPKCDGKGKVVKLYKNPGPNEYWPCIECRGWGYIPSVADEKTTGVNK